MSEKQIFNKDYQLAKMAEKRRNRWKTRDYLVEQIDHVMTKLGDANWIMYQILKNEPQMSHKSKIKLCRWLAVNFYNVEKYCSITENKNNNEAEKICKKLIDNSYVQKTLEANQKLYQQLNEANELLKDLYTHLSEKEVLTAWESIADANTWEKLIDKIKNKIRASNSTKEVFHA